MPKRIMVINDTQEILELFREILQEEAGYEVHLFSFEPQMLAHVKTIQPDLVISDHVFGEEKIGWQFVQRLKMDRDTAGIPVIVCSGAIKDLKEIEGYLMQKNIGVLYKPFDIDELLNLVEVKLREGPARAEEREIDRRSTESTES
ncbi:MAG: two-component system response regulator [Chloroflexia bacterium]